MLSYFRLRDFPAAVLGFANWEIWDALARSLSPFSVLVRLDLNYEFLLMAVFCAPAVLLFLSLVSNILMRCLLLLKTVYFMDDADCSLVWQTTQPTLFKV